ncbi:MAG: choice-of-anchor L domain-containing protein [Flavobacteriales bacterium]
MKKFYTVFFSFILFGQQTNSQIVVDSLAVEQYVQDVLLGNGVQATNISFTGCFAQIGYMHEGVANGLNIDGGVVLSSDHVKNITGVFTGLWNTGCTPVGGDADLLTVANSVPALIGESFSVGSINDKSILEFDFVPTGDTLQFNYIFGSNEYLEWVNSSFNDIFAFFLSGPGITGPYDSPAGFPNGAVNIASIPGTDPAIPITISSVNDQSYDDYYIDNPNHDAIAIDGYTTVLQAFSLVQCGLTYHIKLAIADGSDGALESIVILEEGSFSSNAVVDVDLSINVGGPDANTIWEDCGEATLTFTRPPISSLQVEDMVVVTWNGVAQMGVDYTAMPDTIIFPIGVSEVVLDIDAFEDGLVEGLELVQMDILNLAACNGSGLVTNFEFFIGDEPEPLVVEGYTTEICQGDTITLEPIITGGYGNFYYDWSTGGTGATEDVGPLATTDYFLTVSDTCGMPSDDGEFTVNILVFPPLSVNIDNGDILLPCNGSVNVTATAIGGDGVYTYYWYDENDNNLWGWMNSLWYGSWNGEGEINVDVTDGCGFTTTDVVNVQIDSPMLIVDMVDAVSAPCGQQYSVTVNASGGTPTYWYQWAFDGANDWTQWTNTYTGTTDEAGTLTVIVNDGCGQSETLSAEVTIDSPPIDLELVDSVEGNCTTVFNLVPVVSAGSGGFEYLWTEGGTTEGTGATLNFNTDQTTVVTFLVTDICGAEATDQVTVNIVNPPVTVELGEDINASCIDNTLITPQLQGGSGALNFQWLVNGQVQAAITPTFTYQTFQTAEVAIVVTDLCDQTATDMLTIIIPNIPLSMDAWPPDTAICPVQQVTLSALATGGEEGFVYEWNELEILGSSVNVNPATTTIYSVTATDICGYSITDEVTVVVRPASAEFLVNSLGENNYVFTATPGISCGNEPCTFLWEMGDGNTESTQVVEYEFDGLGSYTTTLHVTNDLGCTAYSSYTITGPPLIYIPGSFTPNGDGINDVWSVVASSLLEYEINIFNRWGEVVFNSTDPNTVWIGDTGNNPDYYAKNDVYTYVVRVKGYNSDSYTKKGIITLIR